MMLKKISYIVLFTVLTLISAKAKSLSSHRSLIHYSDDDKIVKNQVFSSVKRKNSTFLRKNIKPKPKPKQIKLMPRQRRKVQSLKEKRIVMRNKSLIAKNPKDSPSSSLKPFFRTRRALKSRKTAKISNDPKVSLLTSAKNLKQPVKLNVGKTIPEPSKLQISAASLNKHINFVPPAVEKIKEANGLRVNYDSNSPYFREEYRKIFDQFKFKVLPTSGRDSNCLLYSIIADNEDLLTEILENRNQAKEILLKPENERDLNPVRLKIAEKIKNNSNKIIAINDIAEDGIPLYKIVNNHASDTLPRLESLGRPLDVSVIDVLNILYDVHIVLLQIPPSDPQNFHWTSSEIIKPISNKFPTFIAHTGEIGGGHFSKIAVVK